VLPRRTDGGLELLSELLLLGTLGVVESEEGAGKEMEETLTVVGTAEEVLSAETDRNMRGLEVDARVVEEEVEAEEEAEEDVIEELLFELK
jgi:hypothetical protein